jgi:hypothetical protein
MVGLIPYMGILAACLVGAIYGKRKKKTTFIIYRKYLFIVSVTAIFGGIAAQIEHSNRVKKEQTSQVLRKNAGEGDFSTYFEVDVEGMLDKYPIEVPVSEQKLTSEEKEKLFTDAAKELEKRILGKNESLEQIMYDLTLPATLQEGLVLAAYTFDNYNLVTSDGAILQDNIKDTNNLVKVSAQLVCQKQEQSYEFFINVIPEVLSEEERLIQNITNVIEQENNRSGKVSIELPQRVGDYQLKWYVITEELPLKVIFFGLLACALMYVGEKRKKENEQKIRQQKLLLDYPDIVSQLSLLVGAGMTIANAWEKIAYGYQKQREQGYIPKRPGYEEVLISLRQMKDGLGEVRAYEGFGARCGQTAYRKLASLLMQNLKKGTQGIQQLLDAEANEAFNRRKMLARELGEEAGTKLLIPMGIMLILVFIILLVPANLSLQI